MQEVTQGVSKIPAWIKKKPVIAGAVVIGVLGIYFFTGRKAPSVGPVSIGGYPTAPEPVGGGFPTGGDPFDYSLIGEMFGELAVQQAELAERQTGMFGEMFGELAGQQAELGEQMQDVTGEFSTVLLDLQQQMQAREEVITKPPLVPEIPDIPDVPDIVSQYDVPSVSIRRVQKYKSDPKAYRKEVMRIQPVEGVSDRPVKNGKIKTASGRFEDVGSVIKRQRERFERADEKWKKVVKRESELATGVKLDW